MPETDEEFFARSVAKARGGGAAAPAAVKSDDEAFFRSAVERARGVAPAGPREPTPFQAREIAAFRRGELGEAISRAPIPGAAPLKRGLERLAERIAEKQPVPGVPAIPGPLRAAIATIPGTAAELVPRTLAEIPQIAGRVLTAPIPGAARFRKGAESIAERIAGERPSVLRAALGTVPGVVGELTPRTIAEAEAFVAAPAVFRAIGRPLGAVGRAFVRGLPKTAEKGILAMRPIPALRRTVLARPFGIQLVSEKTVAQVIAENPGFVASLSGTTKAKLFRFAKNNVQMRDAISRLARGEQQEVNAALRTTNVAERTAELEAGERISSVTEDQVIGTAQARALEAPGTSEAAVEGVINQSKAAVAPARIGELEAEGLAARVREQNIVNQAASRSLQRNFESASKRVSDLGDRIVTAEEAGAPAEEVSILRSEWDKAQKLTNELFDKIRISAKVTRKGEQDIIKNQTQLFQKKVASEPVTGESNLTPQQRENILLREAFAGSRDSAGPTRLQMPIDAKDIVNIIDTKTAADKVAKLEMFGRKPLAPLFRRYIPERFWNNMNERTALIRHNPQAVREVQLKDTTFFADVTQLFKAVGLPEITAVTQWGERNYWRGVHELALRVGPIYTKFLIKRGNSMSRAVARTIDARDGTLTVEQLGERAGFRNKSAEELLEIIAADKAVMKQLAADGVNLTEASKASQEFSQIFDELALKFHVPRERFLRDYFPHLYEGAELSQTNPELLVIREEIESFATGKRSPFFEKTRKGAEGYLEDIVTAMESYSRAGYRNLYKDRPIGELAGWLDQLNLSGKPKLARSIKGVLDSVLQTPQDFEIGAGGVIGEMMAGAQWLSRGIPGGAYRGTVQNRLARFRALPPEQIFRQTVGNMKAYNALKILGANLRTPVNILLDDVNTFSEIGAEWTLKGALDARKAKLGDKALQLAWEESGLRAISSGRFHTGILDPGLRSQVGEALMVAVDAADLHTKRLAFFAGRAKHLSENPGDLLGAVDAGFALTEKTQPLFLQSTTPAILRTPAGRAFFQFFTPALKQASITRRFFTEKHGKARAIRYVMSVGALYGLDQATGLHLHRQLVPFYWDKNARKVPLLGRSRPGFIRPSVSDPGKVLLGLAATGAGPIDIGLRLMLDARNFLIPIPEAAKDIAAALDVPFAVRKARPGIPRIIQRAAQLPKRRKRGVLPRAFQAAGFDIRQTGLRR